jgi:hypothetical protein
MALRMLSGNLKRHTARWQRRPPYIRHRGHATCAAGEHICSSSGAVRLSDPVWYLDPSRAVWKECELCWKPLASRSTGQLINHDATAEAKSQLLRTHGFTNKKRQTNTSIALCSLRKRLIWSTVSELKKKHTNVLHDRMTDTRAIKSKGKL